MLASRSAFVRWPASADLCDAQSRQLSGGTADAPVERPAVPIGRRQDRTARGEGRRRHVGGWQDRSTRRERQRCVSQRRHVLKGRQWSGLRRRYGTRCCFRRFRRWRTCHRLQIGRVGRGGPGSIYPIINQLRPGDIVAMLPEQTGNWQHIAVYEGEGWAYAPYLQTVACP
jgi:hypothetical protein